MQIDRNSTSGSCQFLGDKLVGWTSKKHNCVSTSTVEVEYVVAASCCSQVIWMKTQLKDYGYNFNKIPIYCDSKSVIAITANPVQHSKTKHIDITLLTIMLKKVLLKCILCKQIIKLQIFLQNLWMKRGLISLLASWVC